MKIRGFIFDLGGVYFEDGTKKAIEFISKEYSIPSNVITDIYYGEQSWQLRLGQISSNEYWQDIYRKYLCYSHIDFKKIWYDGYFLNSDIDDFINSLSNFNVLGIISGNIMDRVEYLESKYSFSHRFNFKLYSFNCGFHKNNIKIYEIALAYLNAYGLMPNETLFIDDNQDCLDAANEVGINTILYNKGDKILDKINSGNYILST